MHGLNNGADRLGLFVCFAQWDAAAVFLQDGNSFHDLRYLILFLEMVLIASSCFNLTPPQI